jgi:hypothetical protein
MRVLRPIALALLPFVAACVASERTIDRGERIHHDDFTYAVQEVERLPEIGPRSAAGIFYAVTFIVENHALRVNHQWNNHIAYVVDARGHEYDNDEPAQRAFARARGTHYLESYITPAGADESTVLVFDLPRDVSSPCLKVRGELLMGDVFDGNQYARTRVRLF